MVVLSGKDSLDAVMEQVAPGVWRVRMGVPEEGTPANMATREPVHLRLSEMSPAPECPIPAADILCKRTTRGLVLTLPLGSDEQVYGLGLQLLSFNQRGKKKTLRVNSDPTVDLGDSHAPVPFYVTTAGYGVLVDTARYATFYFGMTKPRQSDGKAQVFDGGLLETRENAPVYTAAGSNCVEIEVPAASGVDIYLFAGPTILDAVRRYNLFSGGGPLVPRWGLGVWYRPEGSSSAAEAVAIADGLRSGGVPCDVLGLEPGWQSHSYSCTFEWDTGRFPDPGQFVSDLTARNFRVNLWTHAFTHPDSPIYKELEPLSGDHEVWGGLVPDLTLEGARRVVAGQYDRAHVAIGVSGYKLDECDNSDFIRSPWSFPETTAFPSGLDGEQFHSLFGISFQKTIDDLFRARDQRSFHLARNSHAFAAPYPFVIYSDLYNHRDFVRGVANCGFSGLLWTPEVRHGDSEEDLVRRIQAAVFSPMALVNAWYIKNPPWKQWRAAENNSGQFLDNWQEVEARCKRIFEWRMRFLPYLYAAFAAYHLDGVPPFRALVLDYPDDPEVYDVDDAYMMGDRLLVAPIISGETSRDIYLPAGRWRDFWTNAVLDGGKVHHVSPSLDEIPLFVKDDCVLPIARATLHTEDLASLELSVRVYGDGSLPITLFEDDGGTFAFDQGAFNRVILRWDANKGSGELQRVGAEECPRYAVTRWENASQP